MEIGYPTVPYVVAILCVKDVIIGKAVSLDNNLGRCGVISGIKDGYHANGPLIQVTYWDGKKSKWLNRSYFMDMEKYYLAITKLQDSVTLCMERIDLARQIVEDKDGNQTR